jgi:foldase protein PrsA
MKFLNVLLIFLLVIIGANNLRAQSNIIAKIGNKELTKDEFRLRYELSPRILSSNPIDTASLKLKFLYSLLAEKLWAIEAVDKGLSGSEEFNFYYKPIEKMYVRDELFRTQIKDKVIINDNDISRGISKYIKILQVRTLASDDSSNIYNIYSRLNDVGSIDSLLQVIPESIPEKTQLEIKFGDLNNETLEDVLYQLSINEYTTPIQNGDNWFIFELKGIKQNIPEVSQNKLQSDVEEIIRNRRMRILYDDFYKKHFSGYTLNAEEDVFIKVAEEFYKTIKSRINSSADVDTTELYYIVENDILSVKEILSTHFLNRTLFYSKYGQVNVYDFLSDLTLVDVSFKEVNQAIINKVLSNELKRFMQQETISRAGYEMGIQFSTDVIFHLDLWRDNLLTQMLKNSFNSEIKVTENEVKRYYSEVSADSVEISEINFQLINTPDIDQVETILNQLEEGYSFEQIANSIDSSESIYIEKINNFDNLKDFGAAIDIISELNVGDIYGPIETARGYSIIKVIEPGQISDSVMTEIQKVQEKIYKKLYFDKLNELLEEKTIEFANKYGIELSEDFIHSEYYSDVNLFVHRFMGFGGRIAATPFTTPFYKWYYRWKNDSKINP